MTFLGRMDAEHQAALETAPDLGGLRDIEHARALLAELLDRVAPVGDVDGVSRTDTIIPTTHDSGDLLVRAYRPDALGTPAPVLLYMHGGGLVLGNVAMFDAQCTDIARTAECVVVSVEYRLAPEHPYPAALEDCYAALGWLVAASADLGIDPQRVAVGGASAGAGLAAALALLARDRRDHDVLFQLLIYPMLDDRNDSHSAHVVTHPTVWNRECNLAAWRAYLSGPEPPDGLTQYAAPARCADLSGLAPAYIAVGGLDMFLDEDQDYAGRLARAGVPTELHVYPGAFHGSDTLVATSPLSRRFTGDYMSALRRALHGAS